MDDICVTAAVSPWLRRQWSFIFAQICFYTIVNFFFVLTFSPFFLLIYELKFFMFYASHFDLSAFLWVSLKEKKVAHLLIKTISWFSSVWCIRVPFFHRNNLFLSNLSNMKFALCSPIHPNLTNWKYWYYLREMLFWGFNFCDKFVGPAPRYFFYDKHARPMSIWQFFCT